MSNRLPILQNKANHAHRDCQLHSTKAAEKALIAGAALTEAKSLCAHGAWGAWLSETGIPERTAQRYMKLHRAGCIPAIVADLGIAQAERFASLGLKFWPKDGAGMELSGRDAGGPESYSVVWPEGEEMARFWGCYIFPDSGQDCYVTKLCGLPFALGIILDGQAERFDHFSSRRMSVPETEKARARLGVPKFGEARNG